MIRSSQSRSPSWAVLALLAACGVVAGCENKELPKLPAATGDKAPPPPKIPTLEELAKTGPAGEAAGGARAGTGSLQALHLAALGPKETGVIQQIAVAEGDRVRKGQLLFRLDAVQATLALDQAKATLTTAHVQQSSARLDLERTQSLRQRGSVAEDALDQAKSRADAADSMVAQAQAAINIAQRQLANMLVTSPIDGVVAEKRMNVGEIATMMPPSVVLVVQNIDTLELRARLPETALKTVKKGAQINVRFPATGETRKVIIQRIAPTVDARTRTIEIVARVDNPDQQLKAGMLAEVAYAEADSQPTAAEPVGRGAGQQPAAATTKAEADHASR